ncbi:hypothetical protein D8S78_17565 [Natrialba swarupiae]|nr:hypothetical protein [Natrialba swarupiae]
MVPDRYLIRIVVLCTAAPGERVPSAAVPTDSKLYEMGTTAGSRSVTNVPTTGLSRRATP